MFIKRLILIAIAIIMIVSCAEKKDPISPDTQESIFQIVRSIPAVGDPKSISITENTICVAEDRNGFTMYDRSTYERVAGQNYLDNNSLQRTKLVQYLENRDALFLYNTVNSDEIFVIDVANPDSLVYLTTILGGTLGISTLYVMENPKDIPNSMVGGAMDSEIAVLWTQDADLVYGFIDVDYPLYPDTYYWRGSIRATIEGDANNFTMDDNYIYITSEQLGLYILSRTTLEIVGWCDTSGEALDVVLNGNYAYIAVRQDGVQVIDISDPTNPTLLEDAGYNPSYGYGYSVDVMDNYMFVAMGGGGLFIFDVTDPSTPELVQRVYSSEIGYCREVTVYDGLIYVVSRDNGVVILDMAE